jgi:uncharacterized protein YceK
MGVRTIYVALLLLSLPIAGCGTAVNLVNSHPEEGGRSPFGGVRQDMSCIKKSESQQYRQVGLMLLCAADLPFSFVGDVVTWPYTAAYSCINQPTPTPPVIYEPTSPVTQATGPQTPIQLPEPRKLP